MDDIQKKKLAKFFNGGKIKVFSVKNGGFKAASTAILAAATLLGGNINNAKAADIEPNQAKLIINERSIFNTSKVTTIVDVKNPEVCAKLSDSLANTNAVFYDKMGVHNNMLFSCFDNNGNLKGYIIQYGDKLSYYDENHKEIQR